MAKPEKKEAVSLDSLSGQQLYEFRQSLNSDIQKLGEGLGSLQKAAHTYGQTKQAVEQLGDSQEGKPILLPLTSSLYVAGEIAAVDKVMVDIGTGYYVEMSVEDAKKYCDRKIKTLHDNMATVNANLRNRQNNLMSVQAALAEKMQALQQQQQQPGASTSKA